jgi:hypothetical protein
MTPTDHVREMHRRLDLAQQVWSDRQVRDALIFLSGYAP